MVEHDHNTALATEVKPEPLPAPTTAVAEEKTKAVLPPFRLRMPEAVEVSTN